jgi:hypothetical protein
MNTDIGKSIYNELEAGIKSRWDLTAYNKMGACCGEEGYKLGELT